MSKRPDVSAIIVNFNGREITPACLETIPPGVETIVVDNGSTDGSTDEVAKRFPTVTLLQNPANRGFAAAVNQGIDAARGRYVCLLNNDARLAPESLSTLAAYMDAHPQVGMAAPQLLHEDGLRQHSFDNLPSLATVFLNKSLLRALFPGKYPSKKHEVAEPREVESLIGACLMVRRDLIDRIGKLDEAYFLFLEETDWCLRARQAGSRVVFVPQAKVVHLQGRTRDRVRLRARIEYTRSLFTFFRKNRPLSYPLLRLLFPIRTLVEFLTQAPALFARSVRRRWVETAALLAWQLCLCPRKFGLSTAADPMIVTLSDGTRVAEDCLEAFNEFGRKRASARVIKDLRHKKTLHYTAGVRSFFVKVCKMDSWPRRIGAALLGSKAERELRMSLGLLQRGLPTAPVVAMRARGDDHWVAVEKLEDWSQLQEVLLSEATEPRTRRRLCLEYGRFARRLLDAGVLQDDFNPTNVLVRGAEFRVIDLERMKLLGGRVPEADRMRLIGKMNRISKLSRADRLRFVRGYADADAIDREGRKALVREILRCFELQRSIDAERAEGRCVRDNRDFARFQIGDVSGHYLKRRPEGPGLGLTIEEIRQIVEGTPGNGAYRTEDAEEAVKAWRQANRAAKKGGAVPLAVILKKGASGGRIVYPPSR